MNIIFQADDTNSLEIVKNLANKHFNTNLTKTIGKFNEFDLIDEDNKYIIEVKERNNKYNKYPSTMIGYNKYIKGIEYYKNGYSVMFFFKFIDGIYYFKYTGQTFNPQKGGRADRGFNEIKNYIYINIKDLVKIDE